jgi:hypothetical protein
VGTSNSKLLVEGWSGSRWRIHAAPVPSGAQFSELNAVSCTTPLSCIAVGDYVNRSGLDVTLAERWNGSNWAIQATSAPAAAHSFSFLAGVSCTGPGACEAAGGSNAGAFAERWNGTSWSLQAVPAPGGAQAAQLVSVSCAASACEAAGGYVDSSGAFVPLAERWNGATWSAQSAPNPAQANSNGLRGMSCPSSSDCIAVGQGNGAGTPFTLAERWRNGRWRLLAVPNPAGAAENQLNGIACLAIDACVAVGTVGPTRGVLSTEALWWNGRNWHLQQVPTIPGAGLNAVSCASVTGCVAVGGSNTGPLAERWNGAGWRIQPTPNPVGAQAAAFNGISCASAASCMAVGGYMNGTGGQLILAERWNGHEWRLLPAPAPSSQPTNFFIGIACPAPAACIAVGASFDASGNPAGTFAERWNGTRWKVQRTPTQRAPGDVLASVWCKSVTACIAAGNTTAGTLAERLSGTRWSVLRTPNQPSTQGDFLNTVSCTSLSACTSVGLAFAGSSFPTQTVALRWNGARWSVQPTPLLPGAGNVNNFTVACPAPSTCIAAGGLEDDGPGSKTLIERWRGNAAGTAQAALGASLPWAYPGIAGCIRAAMSEGFGIERTATRIEARITAPTLLRPQPTSEIGQITSLCGAA